MIFVELFAPRGALTHDQRSRVGEQLVAAVIPAEPGAPAGSVAAARTFTQVVIHEPETWIAGGDSIAAAEQPRYVVRVSVPASWRKEMSPLVIPAITRVLAEAEADATRLYNEPHAWVQVVGVPEGGCGLFGQAMGSTDIVRAITQLYREGDDAVSPRDLPPGTALDPVCGMTVPLTQAAKIVEDDGVTYAFCASACYAVFQQDRRTVTH